MGSPERRADERQTRQIRSDYVASRNALLRAAERLLAERRDVNFSLAVLAKEAGVSTATAYRHFSDIRQVLRAYYENLVDELIEEMSAVPADDPPLERFEKACRVWVRQAARWSRAAVYIRSADGFLARLRGKDAMVTRLYEVLAPFTLDLMRGGEIPTQTPEFAVLVWETLFDERVVVDLMDSLHWSTDRIAAELTRSALGALGRRDA
ncbi:TetR/AcrR family transcriptional regulator [Streptomyces sp. DSM 44917]|uniref:TetR/AcrR family transcriptional regulator n=1 Tax=Streptomyces boetiae TaxID=3075541 RepID=A0ABU2LFX0_9ACTN|nr:TetR/AcrR family transcriptional regulator [Streptomyces sp. DSM 44917]MDT0310138.1 TetR/AcrR family transcriptional regulator [Streptomyces sp. DSM 44917]